jgi:hypothetical protein
MSNQTLEEVQKAMITARAEDLKKLMQYSGFQCKAPEWCSVSKSVSIDIHDFFDGIWQIGVEVTKVDYYVYRILVEPLLEDGYQPDNDITIDYAASTPSMIVGYFSRLAEIKGKE